MRHPWVAGVGLGLATAAGSWSLGARTIVLEVGAYTGHFLQGEWSRSERAALEEEAVADERTSFYYRVAPGSGRLVLPLVVPSGPCRLGFRVYTRVRSVLGIFRGRERLGETVVRPGRWDTHAVEWSGTPGPTTLDLGFTVEPAPLVRGAHVEKPQLMLDRVELDAPAGFKLAWPALLVVALTPFAFILFLAATGIAGRWSVGIGTVVAAVTVVLVRLAPLPVFLALPRLVPAALVTGILTHVITHRLRLFVWERGALAATVAAGVLLHGSLAFFPEHSPPDLDIHVRRTLDFGDVPLDYQAFLRYGSQLPTMSQDRGAATAALGERTLLPYSPFPNVVYYVVQLAGADLYWAMTVFNVMLAMGVAPLVFWAALRLWGRGPAWTATLLYALDLAVWHHLGRAHAPAVFGNALGTAALLLLVVHAGEPLTRGRVVLLGLALGTAVLGYSSLVVLVGLFGVVLLAGLALDARGLAATSRLDLAGILVVGALVAGGLFYFHYVPGLLRGIPGVEAEPDLFPGKTFFIFHNESRQSLRLWTLGFWIPLLAGLAAAPFAVGRATPRARPILVSWLAAWAAIMLLKEPFLFPKLLRWAKEDQFVSPLLGLFIAGAVSAMPRAWLRWAAALLSLGVAAWLQLRDFGYHAVSLRL